MQITQSLTTFRKSIVNSLTDLNYFVEILNTRGKFSIKVVVLFYLLLGIVLTALYTVKDVPELGRILDTARTEAVQNYPEGVFFDYKEGVLSTNATQPFFIKYPEDLKYDDAPKNLVIIDTTQDHLPDSQSTLMYITSTKIFINSMQGSWSESTIANTVDTEEMKSFHLDRNAIIYFAEQSVSRQQLLLSLLPFGAFFVFTFGLFFVRMISIMINAVIVQLFFQFLNKPLGYKKVLQLSMHVLIPAELITQICAVLFPNLTFPMFGLSFWLLISVILWHMRHLQVLKISIDKEKMEKESQK